MKSTARTCTFVSSSAYTNGRSNSGLRQPRAEEVSTNVLQSASLPASAPTRIGPAAGREDHGEMKPRAVDFVSYNVSDMARSEPFYRDVLGLDVAVPWGGPGRRF